jgi:hypothetical protein
MSLGYIFPLPSPYTEAQQNQIGYEMWERSATTAAKFGYIHQRQRAIANMIGFASLRTATYRELGRGEWEDWRDQCQREKADDLIAMKWARVKP